MSSVLYQAARRGPVAAGVIPFAYFGFQPIGALFYPGYSFVRLAASDLGTETSSQPTLVNGLIFLVGAVIVVATPFVAAGLWVTTWRIAAVLTGACLLSFGAATIAAGMFPLPDSRHGGSPIGAGMFALPFVLFPVLAIRTNWRFRAAALASLSLFGAGVASSCPTQRGGAKASKGSGNGSLLLACFCRCLSQAC